MSEDADRFFEEAKEHYFDLARERNLGIALGRWDHPRFGALRVIAVYGWFGRLYVTLVCCATDAALANEQVRLWWYLSDEAEPFEMKHVATRRPMSETTVRGAWEMAREVALNLAWLETRSIDQVISDLFERNIAPVGKAGEALADPDNELPTGDPEDA